MPVTPDQEARAHAWATVFQDGPATTSVLDDLVTFVASLGREDRAGGMMLVHHIYMRRSQLRRLARKNGKGTPRG